MKPTLKYIYFLIIICLSGCYKEVSVAITADFTHTTQNYTVPATLNFSNLTTGAESYLWTFEGGNPATSTLKNPSVVYKKGGSFLVKLEARNLDGVMQMVEKKVTIDDKLVINFGYSIDGTAVAPAIVQMENNTQGATQFAWIFEGGLPATSTEKSPKVTFLMGGIHKISLKASNTFSSISKDTILTLSPDLDPKFSWTVAPEDIEYEAPTTITLVNESIGAINYRWTLPGANPNNSTEKEPKITFSQAGIYTLTLEASNGKISKTFRKDITIKTNKGYRYIKNLSLGVSTAHGTVGCFYATALRKVFRENTIITPSEAALIDIVYFGLDPDFSFQQFISPSKTADVGFTSITGTTITKFLNNQILVNPADFELLDKEKLQNLDIKNTRELTKFIPQSLPQVVLFENNAGEKGAILLKKQVKDDTNSYIVVDIKVLN